jgi:hypothetical protein
VTLVHAVLIAAAATASYTIVTDGLRDMAVVLFIGTLILIGLQRKEDITTTSITTVVVLVVAGLATHDR